MDETTRSLFKAAKFGDLALAKTAIDSGADIDAKDQNGATPIHYAVRNGQGDTVNLLVENEAQVDAKDKDGETPLHSAARGGYTQIAKLLIHKGADIVATNKLQQTPRLVAKRNGHDAIEDILVELLENAAKAKQQRHAARVTLDRKDKGPPQIGG
jgi:ankyrin repeat protein